MKIVNPIPENFYFVRQLKIVSFLECGLDFASARFLFFDAKLHGVLYVLLLVSFSRSKDFPIIEGLLRK